MEDPRHEGDTPRRYEETEDPRNPPNSVLHRDARRAAVWSYFVPIVVLFAIIGVGLLYWSNRPEHSLAPSAQRSEIGTVGSTEGGFDPQPRPDSPREEVQRRGEDLAPITSVSELHGVDAATMRGRRVALAGVEVDSASQNAFWLRDDDERFEVIAPDGAPAVRTGSRVSLSGRIEDANGAVRIRADRVQVE